MASMPVTWAVEREQPSRERLVRTAARLFVTRGYQGVGVNEICAEAGVLKGSFYHFFPSKDDLAVAALESMEADLFAALDERERAVRGPVRKLRATAEVVDRIQRNLQAANGRVVGCPIGNIAAELAGVGGAAGARAGAVLRAWEARLVAHFRAAEEAGLLVPGADPDDLARTVIATMQGMVLLAKVAGVPLDAVPAAVHKAIDAGLREPA